MRLFNILNAILQKCIQFSSEKFQDVSAEYSSSNLIFYQGWQLKPSNFKNSNFLAILTSPESRGQASVYIISLGATDDTDDVSVLKVWGSTNGINLVRTTSGGIAPIWPSDSGIIDDVVSFRDNVPGKG